MFSFFPFLSSLLVFLREDKASPPTTGLPFFLADGGDLNRSLLHQGGGGVFDVVVMVAVYVRFGIFFLGSIVRVL